jgi:hypothetical protein
MHNYKIDGNGLGDQRMGKRIFSQLSDKSEYPSCDVEGLDMHAFFGRIVVKMRSEYPKCE